MSLVEYSREALADRRPARHRARRRGGPASPTSRPSRCGCGDAPRLTPCPSATTCGASSRTAPRSCRTRVAAQRQREPVRPVAGAGRRPAAGGRRGGADAAPLPRPRGASRCARDLAAYLSRRTGVPLAPEQVWAANGSNEVLQQVLQAFGGPGRTALGFEPSYSMHPLLASGTGTGVGRASSAAADFTLSAQAAVAAVERAPPGRRVPHQPNNPTGTATAARRRRGRLRGDAPGIVARRRGVRRVRRRRARVTLLAGHPRLLVTRTMSKAFAMAGTRLGYLAAVAGGRRRAAPGAPALPPVALTQVAARTALAHTAELLGTVEAVKHERDRMVDGLQALGLDGRADRGQLPAVRAVRRPARDLAGAARPRRAGARRVVGPRARRLAARVRGHPGRDVPVPRGAAREVVA